MLYPQRNKYRQFIDLSGFWDFRFDKNDEGLNNDWHNGFEQCQPIAVPASWNDQFAENRDFLGPAWYQTYFDIPWGWSKQRVIIRFGSVNYLADVWINGEYLGQHEGGHLPFEFDITSQAKSEGNLLIIRVDGTLKKDRIPPGGNPRVYPPANFDFFPYCGIHRPVFLYTIPNEFIKDLTINTFIKEELGNINIKIDAILDSPVEAQLTLQGHGKTISKKILIKDKKTETDIDVKNPSLWAPDTPNLYNLTVELLKNEIIFDSYSLKIGIREIKVVGDKLLLNGKPLFLRGFGRHEDFPITGRGYIPAVIIKDYSLMKWIGANSFRTTHYPYSEQMMDLADQLGFLIIDEIPAVGVYFEKKYLNRYQSLCKQYIQELISRDKNHPSVIIWSLANEPHPIVKYRHFFRELYDFTKEIDPTRPITIVNEQGVLYKEGEYLDIISLNRYYAWYTHPGRIEDGCNELSKELDNYYTKHSKPIILSEFGTDTIPGWHAQPSEMFSEEYQVDFLKNHIELLNNKHYVVGQHVWNLCDFKTGQSIRRMGAMNFKGVFTRDRRPKMAAHLLRKLWTKNKE